MTSIPSKPLAHTAPLATLTARLGRSTILFELLVLCLCLIPGYVFSYGALQEPWTSFRLARANISLADGHIATFVTAAASYRSEHLGGELLQAALISATNWSLEAIGLMPLGALLLTVMYYGLARVVSQSTLTGFAIAIYANYYYPGLNNQFATQTYVWTNALFLCFLILLWYWIENRAAIVSLGILLIFIATFLHYHTTPLWIIAALFAVLVSDWLKRRTVKNLAIVLFCVVLYTTFDTVMYGNGLARIASDQTAESFFQSFMHKVISPLLARDSGALLPFEVAPINARLATWSTLIVLLLLVVPVGCWCLGKVHAAFRARSLATLVAERADVFIWAMLVVTVVHTAIYSFYGALSIRVVQLVFPLLLPLVARSLARARRAEIGLTVAIAGAAVIGFFSFSPSIQPYTTASETGVASALIPPDSQVLSDANAYGALLLPASNEHKVLDFVWPNSQAYAAATGLQPLGAATGDYLAVDKSGKPIITANWRFLQPWTEQLERIEQNPALDKVYDSEHLSLFQPQARALPTSIAGIAPPEAPGVERVARLFAAVLLLFLLPGWVLIAAMPTFRQKTSDDWRILLAVSIGASIALVTFVGYVVNFTRLSLDWFLPGLGVCILVGTAILIIAAGKKIDAVPPTASTDLRKSVGGCHAERSEESACSDTRCFAALSMTTRNASPPSCTRTSQNRTVLRSALRRSALYYRGPAVLALGLAASVTLGWAWLGVGVADARSARGAAYTEFYVAQAVGRGDAVAVSVVSRLAQEAPYSVELSADGTTVQTIPEHAVPPLGQWTTEWRVPTALRGKRITLTLRQRGIATHTLFFHPADSNERHSK